MAQIIANPTGSNLSGSTQGQPPNPSFGMHPHGHKKAIPPYYSGIVSDKPEDQYKVIPPDAPGLTTNVPAGVREQMLIDAQKGVTKDNYELLMGLTIPTNKNPDGGTIKRFGAITNNVADAKSLNFPLVQRMPNGSLKKLKAEDILAWTIDPVTKKRTYTVINQAGWESFTNQIEQQRLLMSAAQPDIDLAGISSATGENISTPGTAEWELGQDNLGFYSTMKDAGVTDKFVMETVAWNFERGNLWNEMKKGGRDLLRLIPNMIELAAYGKDYAQAYAGTVAENVLDVGGLVPSLTSAIGVTEKGSEGFSLGRFVRNNIPFFKVQNPSIFLDERAVSQQMFHARSVRWWEDQGFRNITPQNWLNDTAHEYLKKRMIGEALQDADTDGDGKISKEERKAGIKKGTEAYQLQYTTSVNQAVDQSKKFIKTKTVGPDVGKPIDQEYEAKVIPKMLFDERQAQALMDYSFRKLPMTEKGAKWVTDAAPFMLLPAGGVAKSIDMGKAVIKVNRLAALKKGGVVQGVRLTKQQIERIVQGGAATHRNIYKNFLLEQTNQSGTLGSLQKAFIKARYFPGQLFGITGKAGDGVNAIASRKAFSSLSRSLSDLVAQRKHLLKTGVGTDDVRVVTLNNAIRSTNAKLYHVGTGSKKIWLHPTMKGTVGAEMAVVAGQAVGNTVLPALFDIEEETGTIIGAFTTGFQLHKIGTWALKKGDNLLYHPVQSGVRATGVLMEEVGAMLSTFSEAGTRQVANIAGRKVGVEAGAAVQSVFDTFLPQPGQLVNRNLDDIETILARSGAIMALNGTNSFTPAQREVFKFAIEMVKGLPPKEQRKVWKALRDTHVAKQKLLKSFQTFTSIDNVPLKRSEVAMYKANDGQILEDNQVTNVNPDTIVYNADGTIKKHGVAEAGKYWNVGTGEEVQSGYFRRSDGSIVTSGDEHLDEDLGKLFQQTFGDMTSYAPITSLVSRLTMSLGFKDLNGGMFKKILPAIKEEERTREAVMFGVNAIREKAKLQGLRGEALDAVETWADATEKRFNSASGSLGERKAFFEESIDTYIEEMTSIGGSDGGTDLTNNVIDDLLEIDMHFKLQGKDVDSVEELAMRKESLDTLLNKFYDGVDRSLEELKGSKPSPELTLQYEQQFELLISGRETELRLKASSGYQSMPEDFRTRQIDITNFSEEFFNHLFTLSKQPLYERFSKNGLFFRGQQGNKLRSGLKKSILLDFEKQGFDKNTMFELMSIINAKTGAEGLDAVDLFFMLKNGKFPKQLKGDVDIPEGLLGAFDGRTTVGSLEELFEGLGDGLAVTADYETLEIMYRHFNSLGSGRKNKEEGAVIVSFAEEIDDILKAEADLYEPLAEARKTYQKFWYDKTRDGGEYANITKNRQGPIRRMANQNDFDHDNIDGDIIPESKSDLEKTAPKFAFAYKNDGTPTSWFKSVTESFVEFLRRDSTLETGSTTTINTQLEKFRADWEEQLIWWGDEIVDDATGEVGMGFDLTTPGGALRHKLFKELLQRQFVGNWDEFNQFLLTDAYQKGKALTTKDGIIGEIKPMSDHMLDKIEQIKGETTVAIKDANGVTTAPLIDFQTQIKSERNILNLVGEFDEVHDMAIRIFKDTNKKKKTMERSLDLKFKHDVLILQKLQKLTNIKSPAQFYQEYIINGSPEKWARLKNMLLAENVSTIGGEKLKLTKGETRAEVKTQDFTEAEVEASLQQMESGDINLEEGYSWVDVDTTDTEYIVSRGRHIKKDLLTNVTGALRVETPVDEETFNRMISELVVQGALDLAEYGPEQGGKMQGFNGSYTALGFKDNGATFSTMLNADPTVSIYGDRVGEVHDNLKYALGEDGYDALSSFGVFITGNQDPVGIGKVRIQGLLREITPNEVLSRGFNLARGMVGPYYVAAEVYLRVMGASGIDLMRLTVHSPEAGRLMGELVSNPQGFDVEKSRSLVAVMGEFVATELTRLGQDIPEEISAEYLEGLYYQQQTDPELYHKELSRIGVRSGQQIYEKPTGLITE